MEISTSVVTLQPGLFLLRHPGREVPPLSITSTPASKGKTEVLVANKSSGMTLRDESDCIVMLVTEAPVELLVAAFSNAAVIAKPALKVDRVALGQIAVPTPIPTQSSVPPSVKPIRINEKGLSVIGHVEQIGDLMVENGQILGDPEKSLRLEGFQLAWPDRPQGVDIAYSVAVEGAGTLPVVKTGSFSGTRREARRITEVTFALVGPDAEKYSLDGEACFSGGFRLPVTSGAPLGGPSGLEHLTALAIRISPQSEEHGRSGNPWEESAKTRVFKAKEMPVLSAKQVKAGKHAKASRSR
jgi:hypothetical protein